MFDQLYADRKAAMITQSVLDQCESFRDQKMIPVNVCLHCGEEDDPQDTRHWERDYDDDKMCPRCAEIYDQRVESAKQELIRDGRYDSMSNEEVDQHCHEEAVKRLKILAA